MSFRPPKGTDDILAPASITWRRLLRAWDDWAERFGYDLVVTPLLEATELFERGVGDDSEVVQKQMYTFRDRGGRSLTLRPEATAGVVRAYLAAGGTGIMKVALSGPMFRYEQPQAGRRRQFHQVDAEYLGVEAPGADVEVIELGYRYLTDVGTAGLQLRLNSIGDRVCRPSYLEVLGGYLEGKRDLLCGDSLGRLSTNPMRVLDCKVCAPQLADAPSPVDHLCAACRHHYSAVKAGLEEVEGPYREDPRLVRGLDYYTRTAFEYIGTTLEAAQNALGGGGRYDGLAEALGGKPAPGVGFALGIDRIALSLGFEETPALDVFVVVEDESARRVATRLVSDLRRVGHRADVDVEGRSVKAQFRAADRRRSRLVVLVGAAAAADRKVEIREGPERRTVPVEEVAAWAAR
ncbi:MAG: histidine--tRNA ligase [Acidimicrobiia bacterium]